MMGGCPPHDEWKLSSTTFPLQRPFTHFTETMHLQIFLSSITPGCKDLRVTNKETNKNMNACKGVSLQRLGCTAFSKSGNSQFFIPNNQKYSNTKSPKVKRHIKYQVSIYMYFCYRKYDRVTNTALSSVKIYWDRIVQGKESENMNLRRKKGVKILTV